jgi:hypothetical protein
VIDNYVENESNEGICAVCPDEDIEVVTSNSCSQFPSAEKMADSVAKIATQAGLKTIRLKTPKDESITAITNYLKCPKLKMWCRVGHGNTSGILLGDGKMFNATSVKALGEKALQGKIIHNNSCDCHTGTYESAILASGAKSYEGGDIALQVGPSEKVTQIFMQKIIIQKLEIKKSMADAMTEGKYKGFGISGNGPWFFLDVTVISHPFIKESGNQNCFSISKNKNQVFLSYPTPLGNNSTISIFNLTGRLLYQSRAASNISTWEMTTSSGQKVTSGTYIAVFNNGTSNSEKSFTILKY